jgi:hypothetical protein
MLLALFFSSAINWNADLDVLQREIPNVHPNAFHATTREAFDAAIAKLRASAASMPPNVVIAEMTRIVASIGDGHTRLTIPIDPKAGFFTGHSPTNIPDDPALHFRALPVRFTWFSDGVFITSAANEQNFPSSCLRDFVAKFLRAAGLSTDPSQREKEICPNRSTTTAAACWAPRSSPSPPPSSPR